MTEENGKRQRWTAKRKMEVVLEGLSGKTPIVELCRRHGITQSRYYEWKQAAMDKMEALSYGGKTKEEFEKDKRIRNLEREIPRSSAYRKAKTPFQREAEVDENLAREIQELLDDPRYAGYGYRRVWAVLRYDRNKDVNRKKVQRIMKLKGWQAKPLTRPKRYGGEPYDRREMVFDPKQKIATEKPNQRWCTDLTRIWTREEGWVNIPVLDCFNSEVVGWRLARRGRALEAREALDPAVVNRFGDVRHVPAGLDLRSDNGSIFLAQEFFEEPKRLGIEPEYTPYSCPQANGIAERFMRTIKEECVWQHVFANLEEAERVIEEWIRFYNTERRHSRLGYRTPVEFRERLRSEAA